MLLFIKFKFIFFIFNLFIKINRTPIKIYKKLQNNIYSNLKNSVVTKE